MLIYQSVNELNLNNSGIDIVSTSNMQLIFELSIKDSSIRCAKIKW